MVKHTDPADAAATGPRVREFLSRVPDYVPGKAPVVPDGVTPYKISSNENPFAPLPAVVEAVVATASQVNRYADMGASELVADLAGHLGVPAEHVVATPGSTAALVHVLQAVCDPGDEVVFAWRSFEAYPILATLAGAVPVPVPVTADGRHDLPALAAAVTDRTRMVLLCTPNNPTGPALTRTEVRAFVQGLPPHVVVVVDEAYREFVRQADADDHLPLHLEFENVAVVRTFSKAHGLPGLRVGYLVARPRLAGAVRRTLVPFGVGAPAQQAARASLRPAQLAVLDAQVDEIVARREALVADLRAQGWAVPDAQGNFVWLALGPLTADFAAAAEAVGLSVRPFAGEGVRCSVAEPEANARLVALAGAFVADHPGLAG